MIDTASILFYRKYEQYSGGQQKVLDYFGHCVAHSHWAPSIHWADGSMPLADTPWQSNKDRVSAAYLPAQADAMFLAGMDWAAYLPVRQTHTQPVINLVQHVRHADPSANVYPFLKERAIRVCVSEEVKTAIECTGLVNGPVIAIPNGIDLAYLRTFEAPAIPGTVYILGNKQPALARELARTLTRSGYDITCHDQHTPREQVLKAMAASEISVLLPHTTEGFYLPALEAMALSSLVIVPDCQGNRSFCRHDNNCLMPAMHLGTMLAAVDQARSLLRNDGANGLRQAAHATIESHALDRERLSFNKILDNLDTLW